MKPSKWHPASAGFAGLFCAICLATAGCRDARDPNTCWISGSATCDGQPIATGDLVFESENAATAPVACKVKDGTFTMKVPKGGHAVRIHAFREVPLPPEKRQPPLPGQPPPADTDTVQYLPDRYNRFTTLKVEVTKSGEQFTFDLDSKPDSKK